MDIQEQFFNSIKENDIERVKLLLNNKKINPSSSNNRAIIISSVHGHIEILKLFLNDNRIDPTDRKTPLLFSLLILVTLRLLNYF